MLLLVIMCFSNSVVQIIASYLKPRLLGPFWLNEGLDFELKFKYDVYNCDKMTVRHLGHAVKYFPNIVLIGINFDLRGADDLKSMCGKLGKVRRVGLSCGENVSGDVCMNVFDACEITHLKLICKKKLMFDLEPLCNLQHVMVGTNVDVCGIKGCTMLRTFRVENYEYVLEFGDFVNCKLRLIEANRCTDWKRLGELVNLRSVSVSMGVDEGEGEDEGDKFIGEILGKNKNLRCMRIPNLHGCSALSGCDGLRNVEYMSSLNGLNRKLRKLKVIFCDDSIGEFKDLRELSMVIEHEQTDLKFLSGCKEMREIGLYGCINLVNFDFLMGLEKLRGLTLQGQRIRDDREFEKLGELEELERMVFEYCDNLKSADVMKRMRGLNSIVFRYCHGLECVNGLVGLSGLRRLELWECAMANLPDLSGCMLEDVNISGCDKLERIDGLMGCVSLRHVIVLECNGLVELPDLSRCVALESFHLGSCRFVDEVDGLVGCVNLTFVWLCDLYLERLPNLGGCMLERIDIMSCRGLRDISGLGGCRYLEKIKLSSCSQIEDLRCLFGCASLELVLVEGRPRQLVEEPEFRISERCIVEVRTRTVGLYSDWEPNM